MIEPLIVKKVLRAFENKDLSTINTLIFCEKINPNALIPTKGVTLLHLIIGHQSESFAFKITKLFLRCGGDPNVQSSDGVTPTHVAAGWGRNRILHLLLLNGGDPWIQDDDKKNAFNYAFEEQEWNAIEMLHHFQQMHSAANFKQDLEKSKIKIELEKLILSKGDSTFAYTPIKISTKSIMTQTKKSLPDVTSPVQDKIKYFEPNFNTSLEVNCWKKPEKLTVGWYDTSCEMITSNNLSNENQKPVENNQSFISTVHIDTSATPSSSLEKNAECQCSVDIREQLFIELQEAVRRRSKLRLTKEKSNANEVLMVKEKQNQMSDSSLSQHSIFKDTSMGKNELNVCDADVKKEKILKSMSEFASKVMKEITDEQNIKQAIDAKEATDLSNSSPELINSYSNFDLLADGQENEVKIQTFVVPKSSSDSSTLYLTPYNSNFSNDLQNDKSKDDSNASFMSVTEEYKYTDEEEGVVMLEKKLLVTPTVSFLSNSKNNDTSDCNNHDEEDSSTMSSLPSGMSCNSDLLRCELIGLGYNPGPITQTTKILYLKKLWRMKKKMKEIKKPQTENLATDYSPALEKTITSLDHFEKIHSYRGLEEEMCRSFDKWNKSKWREGINKISFNYLLLDPRISLNLPKRAHEMSVVDAWKCFLSAIFYVGKGKRSRPYAHLYEATTFWKKPTRKSNDKINRIIEIWKENLGVVCLQVFQNIIPVEAFTREAAMIAALKLSNLKNEKLGEYYGIVSTWSKKDKLNLGVYLLHKALMIFLNEGERQIKPYEID